ncbi:D-glycero-alpha-D-manno-heptose-1,7-bisphosphate 7-phosphatase [Bacteroidota bacterium]
MNKAIFLDRDGVLVAEKGHYNFKSEHVIINDGVIEALAEWQQKGYLLIVITNQGGIAKRLYTHKHVKQFHKTLKDFFHSYKIKIHDFYYCPHHEKTGKCLCRKPDSLMLEKAMSKYKINPEKSYFIGDSDRDKEAGEKAGLTPVLIEANDNLSNYLNRVE